jgi:hypothetical protein
MRSEIPFDTFARSFTIIKPLINRRFPLGTSFATFAFIEFQLVFVKGARLMPTRNHRQHPPSTHLDVERLEQESSSFLSGVAEKTREAATYVGEKAEEATEAVGSGMEALGGVIREHEPEQGMLHNAGEIVADKLEGGGRYLEHQGLPGIGADITNLIRRNPIPALLIGVGVGVLLARLMRR